MRKNSTTAKTQTFPSAAPGASSVLLVGDFTDREPHAVLMHQKSNGVWAITFALDPGRHTYRCMVEGESCDLTLRVGNPFGSQDMVHEAA